MTKSFLTLLTVSVATLGLAACSSMNPASPVNKAPGTYKTSTESTNAAGTKTQTKQTTNVYKDRNGDKKAVVETTTTKDPDGLFNKEKSTTVKTYQ